MRTSTIIAQLAADARVAAPDPADRTFTVGTTLEAKRPSGHYRVIEALFDKIEAKE